MLSRVADNLYWMNRYVERAEGVTRLVEVKRDTNLEAEIKGDNRDYWRSALQAMCATEGTEDEDLNDPESFILFPNDGRARSSIASIRLVKMPEWSGINYPKKFGWSSTTYICS